MGNMTDRPHGLETLRYVRLMLLVVPLLLIVAILIYAVVNHRIEDSISSYYLGPARDLFVAMVVATGILLVVYSGAPMEDLALNLAGFYAMFVALVPPASKPRWPCSMRRGVRAPSCPCAWPSSRCSSSPRSLPIWAGGPGAGRAPTCWARRGGAS